VELLIAAFAPHPLPPLRGALEDLGQKGGPLKEHLLLASFGRILSKDARPFGAALAAKFPEQRALIERLGRVLEALESPAGSGPWDWQWSANALAKRPRNSVGEERILRTSLFLHQGLLGSEEEEARLPGTLGFIAKNVAEGKFSAETLETSDLLTALAALLADIDPLLSAAFGGEGPECAGSGAELWQKGVSALLWRNRISALAKVPFNPRTRNERTESHLRLLLAWVEDQVVPTLLALAPADPHLKALVRRKEGAGRGSRPRLLAQAALFRQIIHTPPFPAEAKGKAGTISRILK
jgi:hypothetical protein